MAVASSANAVRDWTDRLGETACPVLPIGGEEDPAGAARSLAIYREGLHDLEAAMIPNASHLVPTEARDRFNTLLLDFLARVDGARLNPTKPD